jgi:hypothetical protein
MAGDQVHGQTLPAGNRTSMETWLLKAATFFEALYHVGVSQVFLNRKTSTLPYSLTTQGTTDCNLNYSVPYYGGPPVKGLSLWTNNRRATYIPVYGLVGVQQNKAQLKAEAVRAFQEYVVYALFGNGTPTEFYRWTNGPTGGLNYSLTAWNLLVQVADAFARNGDTSLYDYTTSLGPCGTSGGPKGLELALSEMAKYIDHTYVRYGTNQSANSSDARYIIDTINDLTGDAYVLDHVLAQSNLYYQSNYVKSIYMRTASGKSGYTVPGYPVNPSTGGYNAWGGPWGNQSGLLFMFGQLEGIVNPYSSPDTSLVPPTNLRLVIE